MTEGAALKAKLFSVMSKLRKMSESRFYHPELDLLRFLAFLIIFFDHASGTFHSPLLARFAEASRVGLPLFFVLSSYLITELLLRESERTGTVHVRNFYVRRILRIWPLYISFLAVIYLAGLFGHGYFPLSALVAFLTFSGSWYSYRHGFLLFGVGVLWSISVEEQFYILWPAVVRAGATKAVRLSIPLLLTTSLGTLCYLTLEGIPADRIWFNSFYQFGYFAVGAALALWLRERHFNPTKFQRLGLFGAAVSFFAVSAYMIRWVDFNGGIAASLWIISFACFLGITSTCLFLGCFNLTIRDNSPLVQLGKISYGLYVFHLLALQVCEVALRHMHIGGPLRPFAHVLLALALTYLAARLSYRYLESPFLKLKDRFASIRTRSI